MESTFWVICNKQAKPDAGYTATPLKEFIKQHHHKYRSVFQLVFFFYAYSQMVRSMKRWTIAACITLAGIQGIAHANVLPQERVIVNGMPRQTL